MYANLGNYYTDKNKALKYLLLYLFLCINDGKDGVLYKTNISRVGTHNTGLFNFRQNPYKSAHPSLFKKKP